MKAEEDTKQYRPKCKWGRLPDDGVKSDNDTCLISAVSEVRYPVSTFEKYSKGTHKTIAFFLQSGQLLTGWIAAHHRMLLLHCGALMQLLYWVFVCHGARCEQETCRQKVYRLVKGCAASKEKEKVFQLLSMSGQRDRGAVSSWRCRTTVSGGHMTFSTLTEPRFQRRKKTVTWTHVELLAVMKHFILCHKNNFFGL